MSPNMSCLGCMDDSTLDPCRISSLGCAVGVSEVHDRLLGTGRKVGMTDDGRSTSQDTLPCLQREGGLPWGMVDPGWSKEEKVMVTRMLDRVRYAFQKHELDHSFVIGKEVGIETGDATPVVLPNYRMDQIKLSAGRKLIKQFLIMKIIEPSHSSWRSPLLLIRKPDGTFRMTTDLRGLNPVTKKGPVPSTSDRRNVG